MKYSADRFDFFPDDNRLNFNFFTLFSCYEKIENTFINSFLQRESLKAAVLDFPFNPDEGGASYFNEISSKCSDCFYYTDTDNSVQYCLSKSLNNYFNDNFDYSFDYGFHSPSFPPFYKSQKDESLKDLRSENYQSECINNTYDRRKEKIVRQAWENNERDFGQNACLALPLPFSFLGERNYRIIDMGKSGFCLENDFEGKRINDLSLFRGSGSYFANVGLGNIFDAGVFVLDLLVQSFGEVLFDKAGLLSQEKYKSFFDKENQFAVSIENRLVLETAKLLLKKNQDFEGQARAFADAVLASESYKFFEGVNQAVKRPDMFSWGKEQLAEKTVSEPIRIERAYDSSCGFFFGQERRALKYAHIAFLVEKERENFCRESLRSSFEDRFLMRQKGNLFEIKLYSCESELGELRISPDDVREALRAEVSEYFREPVKAEIKVDMSGMKNIINKETSIDSIVTDLTAAISEAVTSVAEGVHNL